MNKILLKILPVMIVVFTGFLVNVHGSPGKTSTIPVNATDTESLKNLLEGQKIEAMLVDGTYIKGRVIEIDDREIEIKVKKSSGTSPLDKGENTLLIKDVSTIIIKKYKGGKRFILAVGLGAGLSLAGWLICVAGEPSYAVGVPLIISFGGAGGTAGYFWGKHLDKQEITIVIKN